MNEYLHYYNNLVELCMHCIIFTKKDKQRNTINFILSSKVDEIARFLVGMRPIRVKMDLIFLSNRFY